MEKTKKIEILSKLMRVLEDVSIAEAKNLLFTLENFIANAPKIKESERYEDLLSAFLET